MPSSRRFWLGLVLALLVAVSVLPPAVPARAQTGSPAPQATLAIRWAGPGTRAGTPLQLNVVEVQGNHDLPAPGPVTWSAQGATVSAQGVFVAPAPGEYRVTATTLAGSVAATVSVWGPPDRLILQGPNTVAGDGTSVSWITARVVDSRDTPVADYNGDIRLLAPGGGRLGGTDAPGTDDVSERIETARAGVGQFSLVVPAGLIGQELRVIGWVDADGDRQYDIRTDVAGRYVARVVPALDLRLRLRPVSSVLPAGGAAVALAAELVDADGHVVTGQPVAAQVRVVGPGRVSTVEVNLEAGRAGLQVAATGPGPRVWVQLTAPGLAPAEVTLPVAMPGPAIALVVTADGTAEGQVGTAPKDGVVLHVGAADEEGTPVPAAGRRVMLLIPHAAAAQLRLDGRPLPAGAANADGMAVVPITLTGAATTPIRLQAIRYTGELPLEIQPETGNSDSSSLAPAEAAVRFLPGDPALFNLISVPLEIPNARPGFTLRAEVQDRFGNLVPVTGVRVRLTYTADPATVLQFAAQDGKLELETTEGRGEIHTGVHGKQGTTVTFQVDQALWQWLPLRPVQGGGGLELAIQPAVYRSLQVKLVNGAQTVPSVSAGDMVRILVIAKDPKGVVASDWATLAALKLKTLSTSPYELSFLTWSYDPRLGGYVSTAFGVGRAGSWPVTITYDPLNKTRMISNGTVTLRVLPGQAEGVRLYDSTDNAPRFPAGSVSWPFRAKVVDDWGNPTSFYRTTNAAISIQGPPGGDLAVSQSAAGPALSSLTITSFSTVYLSATVPGVYRVTFQVAGRDSLTTTVIVAP